MTQQSKDEYLRTMRRSNGARFDYIRARLAELFEGLDHEFTGRIQVDAPILKGTVGRVEITISDRQME